MPDKVRAKDIEGGGFGQKTLNTFKEIIKRRIPGDAATLPSRINVWGREIPNIPDDELQRLNYLRQQTEELKEQKKETASKLRDSGITDDQIDQASRDPNLNRRVAQGQTLSNIKSSLGTAGTDALSSGITTALIMAISGVDFSTVIKILNYY